MVALVVEVDGRVLGQGQITKRKGALAHVGELACGLQKDIREQGIGSKLMKALIREAENKLDVEILTLGVFHTNTKARRFYKKFGFENIGRIENGAKHYGEYKDMIIMKKRM